jgi:hypothetical protein
MHSMRHFAAGFLACSTAGCLAVQPQYPREWFEVSGGVFEDDSPRPVDEGFGWSIGGGYDFNSGPVRVSWEIAAAWSPHDVDQPPIEPDENDVDLFVSRWSTGIRAALRSARAPVGLYVHGGGMWREESSNDSGFADEDQWGYYAGGGLEWWYEPFASLGPAYLRFIGDEDVDEDWVGLVARFYL